MKNFFTKIFKKKQKIQIGEYKKFIIDKISSNKELIIKNKTISFLHYGHLGDIINSLPVLQELSKSKDCNLYLQINKKIPDHVVSKDHPFGEVYLSETSCLKMLPLLKSQKYLNKVEIF